MSTVPKQPVAADHDPDLDVDINVLLQEVIPDADVWKVTPNPVLGGYRPVDMIGTPREHLLRDLIRAAKHGFFS